MLTLNKTKAALQSCQCYYQKLKQGQNTKGSAGGQRMSAAEAMGTAPMAGLKSGLFLTPNLAEGCAPMERLKHNLMILKQSVILRCVLANSGVADLQLSREGANKRGNSSRLTQSFHFFMFEPIFSPVNALNQPI